MAETIMYSKNPLNGETVIHRLPYKQDGGEIQNYLPKGFTFEPPKVDTQSETLKCDVCDKPVKSEIGLISHMRTHNE